MLCNRAAGGIRAWRPCLPACRRLPLLPPSAWRLPRRPLAVVAAAEPDASEAAKKKRGRREAGNECRQLTIGQAWAKPARLASSMAVERHHTCR